MKALLSPIAEFTRGFTAFIAGWHWLRAHPRYLLVLFAPIALGLILLGSGWGLFFQNEQFLIDRLMFARPESAWWLPIYYAARLLLYVALLVLSWVACMLLVNILAAPIYEWVSLAVERSVLGDKAQDIGLWASLKLMLEEFKKAAFILFVSILLLLIPGFNVICTLVTAFLIGWNFYDYPLARRGWRFNERLRFVSGDFWAVMGLGVWLVIPFLQFVFMPLAVVGGTMLNLEKLQRQQDRAA